MQFYSNNATNLHLLTT